MTIAEMYGRFAADLTLDTLPPEVVSRATVCICDAIDCCLISAEDPRKAAALASIQKSARSGCSLWGANCYASAEDAAFYNGVSGGISSRNDISRISGCHPGSILVPAVLALAQEQRRSGQDIVCAVVAGYETMIRFGNTLRQAGLPSTFRGTAMIGAMGTAVAAAKVLGLDAAGIAAAASFAVHSCFGLNEWTWAGTGEDVLQNGWAARNGILAARLAQAGLPAAPTIFEGQAGFLRAFHAQEKADLMTERLGRHYYILDVRFKEICACINVQTAGQAAAALAKTYHPAIDAIQKVTIFCSEHSKNFPGCDNTEVHNLVQAIMSIQFTVASSLVGQQPGKIRWAPPYQKEILALTKKCVLQADAVFSVTHYERQSSRILVKMNDGTTYSYEQPDVITPTEQQVLTRFEENLASRIGAEQAAQLCAELENIARLAEPAAVLRSLSSV